MIFSNLSSISSFALHSNVKSKIIVNSVGFVASFVSLGIVGSDDAEKCCKSDEVNVPSSCTKVEVLEMGVAASVVTVIFPPG